MTRTSLLIAGWMATHCLLVATASANITIATQSIGNPGNAADAFTGGNYGSVSYAYNIGRTEVTNAQYAAFLNAKAASDPNGLYNANMAGSLGGIIRSGSEGSYTYSAVSGRANNPVNWVSFWDSTRFANWLHNGQGNGDTEDGAYTLTAGGITANSVTRNAGWQWAVSSENEWYKAAYFQPAGAGGDADNYWRYTTGSNNVPTAAQGALNGNGINNTVAVGSYAANYFGLFDMTGNVQEWTEAIAINGGSVRALRGGSFYWDGNATRSDYRNLNFSPASENAASGFRVVNLPAPGAIALLGFAGLAGRRRR